MLDRQRTFRDAGPEILMIAMADLPGAVDKAKIVGSPVGMVVVIRPLVCHGRR